MEFMEAAEPMESMESMEIHGPGGFCVAATNLPVSSVRKLHVHKALNKNAYTFPSILLHLIISASEPYGSI